MHSIDRLLTAVPKSPLIRKAKRHSLTKRTRSKHKRQIKRKKRKGSSEAEFSRKPRFSRKGKRHVKERRNGAPSVGSRASPIRAQKAPCIRPRIGYPFSHIAHIIMGRIESITNSMCRKYCCTRPSSCWLHLFSLIPSAYLRMRLLDSRRCDSFNIKILVKSFGKPSFSNFSMLHPFAILRSDRKSTQHSNGQHQVYRYQHQVVFPSLHKVTVITTTTFDSTVVSKDTTAWKGSRGETKLSFVQSLENITGSIVYVCNDKIILCTNNAEPVFGLEPTVAIGTRSTT
jgi:hypothetical protein